MPFRYELTNHFGRVSKWRVTGPGVVFGGPGRRGYLTLPPLEMCDTDGVVDCPVRGEPAGCPTRHVLTSPDGAVLATFDTRLIARVVETRRTTVTGAGGGELCTLVPVEAEVSGVRETLAAALEGGYNLTLRGAIFGRVEASGLGSGTAPPSSHRCVGIRYPAGSAVGSGGSPLQAMVLDPSRVPES